MTVGEVDPRLDYVMCTSAAGAHRMAYWEWGDPHNPKVLLCVHGLSRTGRDFDPVARAFAHEYRVVCPDIVGRGRSDWLLAPTLYAVPQYVADILTLIARLQPKQLDWIGTSMGGLVALGLVGLLELSAAVPVSNPNGLEASLGLPLGKIVLNDIGPTIEAAGLARIATQVGQAVSFTDFDSAEAYIRQSCAEFGPHADEDWRELTRNVLVRNKQGRWVRHYDMKIAEGFTAQINGALAGAEALLWQSFQAIKSPVLIVRGEQSDLLSRATAERMLQLNDQAQLYEVAGVGHAPTLRDDRQLDVLRNFLM